MRGSIVVSICEVTDTDLFRQPNCGDKNVIIINYIGLRGAVTPPHLWEDWPYFLDKVVLKSMLAANSGQVRDTFW